jgi:hypothetical protein
VVFLVVSFLLARQNRMHSFFPHACYMPFPPHPPLLRYQDVPTKVLYEFLSSLIRDSFESHAIMVWVSHLEIEIRSGDMLSWQDFCGRPQCLQDDVGIVPYNTELLFPSMRFVLIVRKSSYHLMPRNVYNCKHRPKQHIKFSVPVSWHRPCLEDGVICRPVL